MMTWKIESVTPSDGRRVMSVTVDHVAWLRGDDDGARIHVCVQMSSRGVSEQQFRTHLNSMIAGLNKGAS